MKQKAANKKSLNNFINHNPNLSLIIFVTIVLIFGYLGIFIRARLNLKDTRVIAHLDRFDNNPSVETVSYDEANDPSLSALTAEAADRRVGIISVNVGGQTVPVSQIQSVFFDGPESVKAFYAESSYGKLILTPGQSIALSTPLSFDTSRCTDITNLVTSWSNTVMNAAKAEGYNESQNDNTVIVFPFKCGSVKGVGPMPGKKLFIYDASSVSMGFIGHEFGHNLGFGHAAKVQCQPGKLPPNCQITGGDNLSIMGGGTRNQPNNIHKAKAGWVTHQKVLSAGSYSINPIEVEGNNSITVPASAGGGLYYLEYRKAIGFDSNMSGNPATQGISIRTAVKYGESVDSELITILAKDQIFTDPNGKTKIKACEVGGAIAKIGVSFDGSVPTCTGGTTPPDNTNTPIAKLFINNSETNSITASSSAVTLRWECQNSNQGLVTKNNQTIKTSLSGSSYEIISNGDTLFKLACSKTGQTSAIKQITVKYNPTQTPPTNTTSLLGKPSIPANSQFSTGPITVKKNVAVILSWVCSNSDKAKLVNDSGTQVGTSAITGTFNTKAFNNTGNKIYKLTCYKNNSVVANKSITIKVTN